MYAIIHNQFYKNIWLRKNRRRKNLVKVLNEMLLQLRLQKQLKKMEKSVLEIVKSAIISEEKTLAL